MHSLKYPVYVLAVAVTAALAVSPARADGNLPQVQQQGNISYLSGGIGKEESDAMEATRHNYNLRIMSADQTGHYSGNTHVMVSNLQHRTLLDITGGPLFYANLPNGRYIVKGSDDGQSRSQAVTIAAGKPVNVHFSWPQHFSDASH